MEVEPEFFERFSGTIPRCSATLTAIVRSSGTYTFRRGVWRSPSGERGARPAEGRACGQAGDNRMSASSARLGNKIADRIGFGFEGFGGHVMARCIGTPTDWKKRTTP